MSNNLRKLEKELRSFAKRAKTVKYTKALLFNFLMIGILSFASSANINKDISDTRKDITTSISDIKNLFKDAKAENNRLLKNSNLELIQLMEQGDHVVKSPWSSWQYGVNYFYQTWNGIYKGMGDKKEKYPFEGIYTRSDDLFMRSVSPNSKNFSRYIRDNSDAELARLAQKGITDLSHSATSSIRGNFNPSYGLESSVFDQEPVASLNLLATVKPKEVNKAAPTVNLGTIEGPGKVEFSITPPVVEINQPEMKEISFIPINPIMTTLPTFNPTNLKIESFRGSGDSGAYNNVENQGSFRTNTGSIAADINLNYSGTTPLAPEKRIVSAPAVFSTRDAYGNNGAAFKSYFEVTGGNNVTFNQNIVIDSVRASAHHSTPIATSNPLDNQNTTGTGWTVPSFLVGGSRVGTLANGTGSITNTGNVDLAGVLVAGFVAETSGTSGIGERKLVNGGTITDAVETTHYQDSHGLGGLLVPIITTNTDGSSTQRYSDGTENNDSGAKASTSLNLPGYSEMGPSVTITRTTGTGTWNTATNRWDSLSGGGYVGYKIGLLLAHEDQDTANTYTLENTGNITFNGTDSIGIQVEADGSSNVKVNALNNNSGIITLNGGNSYGMKVSSRIASTGSSILNKGIINMNSGNSAGMAVIEERDSAGDSSGVGDTIRAHTGIVKNENTININGERNSNAVGMYLQVDAADDITNAGTINVDSLRGVGMWVKKGAVSTDTPGTPNAYNDGKIILKHTDRDGNGTIESGASIGMVADGVSIATNRSTGEIELTGTRPHNDVSSAGMFATGGGTIDNVSGAKITGSGNINTLGMAIDAGNNTGINAGTITLSGTRVGGVYNKGTFTNTGNITMTGSGAAVYSDIPAASTNINSGNITVTGNTTGAGMIAYFANGGSTINIGTPTTTVNENALLFYNNPTASAGSQANKFNLTGGNANATIKANGLAFYFKEVGTMSDIGLSISNMLTGSGKVVLNLENDSQLYVLENSSFSTGTPIRTSDFGSYTPGASVPLGPNVEISSSSGNYRIMTLKGGSLEVNTSTDLDDSAAIYNRITKESSSIKLMSGTSLTRSGNTANQIGIGQRNTITSNAANMVLENAGGSITLEGTSVTGIAAETGTVINDGDITLSGDKSTGLYGADGSIITNELNGLVTIGTGGAGILAERDLDGTLKTDGKITVENKGKIIALIGKEKVIGIYADNTNAGPATSTVKHTSGDINLSGATKSLGIFTNNLDLTSAANIIVKGKGSAGIQGKNSKVDITGGTIEIGDESIGVILENHNSKNFNGSGGTIAISGKDSVGYYLLNSTINTTNFVDGLTLNPNGNKYTYIYAKGSTIDYENTKTIDTDGSVFINAENSSVTLGANNVITSTNNKVVGVYLKDSAGKSAINKGNIDLSGDKSVAMYGEGGGTVVNEKDIKVGSNGVGLYNKTGSEAKNISTGTIVLDGDYGIGMRSDNATGVSVNEGKIESSKLRAVGMSSSNGSNDLINNSTGTIVFTGQESIGMHTDGLGTTGHGITNAGKIELSDAVDPAKPNIGIYSEHSKDKIINDGIIKTGHQTIGIYSKAGGSVSLGGNSSTEVGDNAVGIFANGGNIDITSGAKISIGNKLGTDQESVAVYYAGSNGIITNNTSNIIIGDGSLGFVMKGGSGNTLNSNNPSGGIVDLNKESVFIYDNSQSTVNNATHLRTTGDDNYGIYTNGGGINIGNFDFSQGKGNVGIYSYLHDPNYINNMNSNGEYIAQNTPAKFTNNGTIQVSASDLTNAMNQKFGIGMGAGYVKERIVYNSTTGKSEIKRDVLGLGNIENGQNGVINVTTPNSIGMYAGGLGSKAINRGTINLSGTELNVGMFLEDGAEGHNYGTINVGSDEGVGIALLRGATLYNHPGSKINVTGVDAYGIAYVGSGGPGSVIVNYGDFILNPSNTQYGDVITVTGDGSQAIARVSSNGDKEMGYTSDIANWNISRNDKVAIKIPEGSYDGIITLNGVEQTPIEVSSIENRTRNEIPTSAIGIYLDTSGVNVTRPVTNLGLLTGIGIKSVDLIIGTEATNHTTEKYLKLSDEMIEPYNDMILEAQRRGLRKWEIYSSSLTWMASAAQNKNTQVLENVYLVKVPYTVWAGKEGTPVEATDTYNFLDGLEQRYGVEKSGRERELFKKLNSIGNNEHILLVQAFDEMMGHQYGNAQMRMNATGNIIDKEVNYLMKDWSNPSKQSNKIKAFGMRDEYKTDTAGIIDYTSNSYGIAYVNENETLKLGNSSGWYAGAVYNKFNLKDIGKSKEEQTMIKAGIFKTMSPSGDHNGNLTWTIAGEGFAGINSMNRRYLVVDDIFQAKADYYTYGLGLKNEIGYNIRTSERTSIRPYAALDIEYGRFTDIKEDDGEVRLEVKSNDYYSIKPEVGVEFKYKQPMAVRTNLVATLGIGYENELGKVGDVGNKARVRYTEADWFNIRGEKDDRRGNGKIDLKIGIENTRFGVTFNAGYDTKGENIRGGIGFRAIY